MALPRLRISSLDDSDNLANKIDVVLRDDAEVRRRSRKIVRLQQELRAAVGDDNFVIYMNLEEVMSARSARALDLVAVWSFTEGLRASLEFDLDDGL